MEINVWEPRDIAEVWVQVYSTELVNLTDIVAKMDDEQKRLLDLCNREPVDHSVNPYHLGIPYKWDECWAFAKKETD